MGRWRHLVLHRMSTAAHNELRSLLREYYPGFLAAFRDARGGIMRPEARMVLSAAPTPAQAAALSIERLADLLRKAGRQRGVEAEAHRLGEYFTAEYMRQPVLVEQALGRQASALLRALDAACVSVEDLATAAEQAFDQHPDAEIITSFAGIGRLVEALDQRPRDRPGRRSARTINDARRMRAGSSTGDWTNASVYAARWERGRRWEPSTAWIAKRQSLCDGPAGLDLPPDARLSI